MLILFRYSLYFFVSISALVSISSCVTYGPDTENKSAADIFNRKNYEGGMVLFVPVLKSKKRDTFIEGTVYITDYRPLKYHKLILVDKNNSVVSEATTLQNGEFKFIDYILNGEYVIKIDSKEYSGEAKIKVDDYQLSNIGLTAKPN